MKKEECRMKKSPPPRFLHSSFRLLPSAPFGRTMDGGGAEG
jgi:hypothetical protein